jgi:hypothetical protein
MAFMRIAAPRPREGELVRLSHVAGSFGIGRYLEHPAVFGDHP